MKRLITILAVFSLACLGAGVAFAESAPPSGYNIIDFVNIGDTAGANTEGGRTMTEWGPSFDAGIWFSPENSDYYRQIWGWTTPPGGYPAGTDLENWAEIDLNFTKPAHTGQLNIGFFFLAGSGNDNFNVYIGGTMIGTVTETQTSNTMMREFLAVPAGLTTGVHTVRLECSEPGWTSQATYGQVTIDEIYTFTDPLIDPIIEPVAVDSNPINCSGTKLVDFHYVPGLNPDVRGYTVRVSCDASLTFGSGDIIFNTVPTGVSIWTEITEVIAGHVYDVDYAIMGGSVGISAAADLFSVNFHGAGTGTGVVSMVSVDLRDLDNIFITPVTSDGTAGIPVDCTAPDIPVMDAGEDYTQGLTNTVFWTDMSASGATLYYAECATDDQFTVTSLVGNSGEIAGLSHEFTGLTDGEIYYYRVWSKDALGNQSVWSNVDSSTQDNAAPVTKVTALDQFQVDSFFDVSYEIELPEDGSDFTKVELFYKGPGVPTWTYYGEFVNDTTPLVFNTGMTEGDPDGTFYFYSKGTDHVGNFELPPIAGSPPPPNDYDATTTVDMTDLVVNFFKINNDAAKTGQTLVELTMEVPGAVDMQFSNDGTTWSGWVLFESPYPWTLTTGEGNKTVYAHFMELPSYRVTDADDDIILDTTAPDDITDLSAERGLEKVKLTWTNPGDDQTGVEIWRAVWRDDDDDTSAYPEYDDLENDVIPTVHATRAGAFADAAWTEVNMGGADYTLGVFADLLPDRGIYYYVVYPVDGAGLYGDGNGASSISYLLGDVQTTYDGTVLAGDVTILSTAYGTTHAGGGDYNNECDVGPTSDYSGSGIPATDNNIDFDDLMIFALNWNMTPLTKAQPAEGSLIARFSWVEVDDTTWSLVLSEPCANLKGVNLQADLSRDADLSVTAGSLMGQQDYSYFLQNISANGLDAGLALLGNGACIIGQGELIRISLTGELDLDDIEIVARDSANKDLEYTLEETTADADMPTRYALSANYPNPFNPSTTIKFALPEPQYVKLAIFAVDGRRIATLKSESMSAGNHSVTWTGRDDRGGFVATGIYFYRIEAGDFSQTHKMTLMK